MVLYSHELLLYVLELSLTALLAMIDLSNLETFNEISVNKPRALVANKNVRKSPHFSYTKSKNHSSKLI